MTAPGMRAKVASIAKPVTRRKYFPNLFIFDSPCLSAQPRVRVSGAREFALLLPPCSVVVQNHRPASPRHWGQLACGAMAGVWSVSVFVLIVQLIECR